LGRLFKARWSERRVEFRMLFAAVGTYDKASGRITRYAQHAEVVNWFGSSMGGREGRLYRAKLQKYH
jgi:hypothetical protein